MKSALVVRAAHCATLFAAVFTLRGELVFELIADPNALSSEALGISGDGSTVFGEFSGSDGFTSAFRWQTVTGLQDLGTFTSPQFDDVPIASSDDGAVILGLSRVTDEGRYVPFRWTSETGVQGLKETIPYSYSVAGLSDDGLAAAGHRGINEELRGFRWELGKGLKDLGDLPGGTLYTSVAAISGDGSTVVGSAESAEGRVAYRWTVTGGMQGLGSLPGPGVESYATDVSEDGSVVVGRSLASGFYWTEETGIKDIGALPGSLAITPYAVSADGSTIVGISYHGVDDYQTFRWRMDGSMQGAGVNLNYQAVSADGSLVLGELRQGPGESDVVLWDDKNRLHFLSDLLAGHAGLSGFSRLTPGGISTDGDALSGTGFDSQQKQHAFRVTGIRGALAALGDPVYTVTLWRLRAAQESSFIQAWSNLILITNALDHPPLELTLIRSKTDPQVFYSYGSWRYEADLERMREDAASQSAFFEARALCDDVIEDEASFVHLYQSSGR